MFRTACALTCLTLAAAPVAAQPRYCVTVIGGMPQSAPTGPLSLPLALNGSGRVVGYGYSAGGGIEALDWQSGVLLNLGGIWSFDRTFANCVNANGRIAGAGYLLGPGGQIAQTHALKWTNGVMTDLGGLGGSHAAALALNDIEQIVGYATLPGDMHVSAFLFQNGLMTAIATLPGATESYAYDISNSGYIVGTSVAGAPAKPFIWHAGVASALPIPAASRTGAANAVNDAGAAAGSWEIDQYTGAFAACVWTAGQRLDLPCLGGPVAYALAADINNLGQVVGTSNSAGGYTGFLFQNQHMYDLRSLVMTPLAITSANAINDRGQIAASATIAGRQTAVLLTPLPATVQAAPGISLPRH